MDATLFDQWTLDTLRVLHATAESSVSVEALRSQLSMDESALGEVLYFLEASEMIECDHTPSGLSHVRLAPRGRLHLETKQLNLHEPSEGKKASVVPFVALVLAGLLLAFGLFIFIRR
jgi:hypothetical protein